MEPKQYRKLPVVIEAIRWNGSYQDALLIGRWSQGKVNYLPFLGTLAIRTLEGVMQGAPGDWIIRGVEGEFYPCKHEIFVQTYAEVEDA